MPLVPELNSNGMLETSLAYPRISKHFVPSSRYFTFCEPYSLLWLLNCAIILEHETSHRQYINEWAWLCSNKTLSTKKGNGLDLTHGAKPNPKQAQVKQYESQPPITQNNIDKQGENESGVREKAHRKMSTKFFTWSIWYSVRNFTWDMESNTHCKR